MAVQKIALGINLRQNKNSQNAGYGKYYPEVDVQKTLSLRGFAQHMTDHGSFYGRDVIEGVLIKITECLPELISQGVPIQLGSLGTFYPTAEVAKDAAIASIGDMEGLNPNDVVKAIHIRFLPDSTKSDNLSGPSFKDACSLEFRNIVDTIEVTLNGKTKKMQTLKPIATAIAEYKAANGGSFADDDDNQGGSDNSGSTGGSDNGGSTSGNPSTGSGQDNGGNTGGSGGDDGGGDDGGESGDAE